MAQQEYLVYALAAMILFSMGNIALKQLTHERSLQALKSDTLFIAGVCALIALAAIYLAFFRSLPGTTLALLLGAGVLGVMGFIFFLQALHKGSPAIVTAIASLSTVVVAIIGIFLFPEHFEPKQLVALGLAVASLLMLAF